MSPFSFFLLFSGAKNVWICEAVKDSSGASSKGAFVGFIWRSLQIGTAFSQCCDVVGLQIRPPKDADTELGHCLSAALQVQQNRKEAPSTKYPPQNLTDHVTVPS